MVREEGWWVGERGREDVVVTGGLKGRREVE